MRWCSKPITAMVVSRMHPAPHGASSSGFSAGTAIFRTTRRMLPNKSMSADLRHLYLGHLAQMQPSELAHRWSPNGCDSEPRTCATALAAPDMPCRPWRSDRASGKIPEMFKSRKSRHLEVAELQPYRTMRQSESHWQQDGGRRERHEQVLEDEISRSSPSCSGKMAQPNSNRS